MLRDGGGRAHMLVAAKSDNRAEHGEPEEQYRSELVRPDERAVEDVARHDAREQDRRLRRDKDRDGDFDESAEEGIACRHPGTPAGGDAACGRVAEVSEMRFGGCHAPYDNLPTAFSRIAHASSPYLPFHST
jgi:hypothetical protein